MISKTCFNIYTKTQKTTNILFKRCVLFCHQIPYIFRGGHDKPPNIYTKIHTNMNIIKKKKNPYKYDIFFFLIKFEVSLDLITVPK